MHSKIFQSPFRLSAASFIQALTNITLDKLLYPAFLTYSTSIIWEWGEHTCENSILLTGLTPADFERGVQNLSETQVTHSTRDWAGTKKDNERG